MGHKDPSKMKEYNAKYLKDLKQNSLDSITSCKIIDQYKWNVWCNIIKSCAKQNKHPYSDDFTNDNIFKMLIKGCFYCGQLSTGVDRADSTIDHTLDNCVASCWECNNSKGAADSDTFVRKSYYRARGYYLDDNDDIWFVNKTKPRLDTYKKRADKKEVSFELSKEDFDILIKGDCDYCKRSPTTWFGIDRVAPSSGYVVGNVVPCCWDCNIDKHEGDAETMIKRNKRIADRVDSGEFVFDNHEQVILHQGAHPSSRKVCAYGIVYASKMEASRALGKSNSYVKNCILYDRHSADMFEIKNECKN